MTINSKTLGIVIVVMLFGGIFGASAMNLWQTESSKIPARFQEGAVAGEYNPADIRGSYRFGDVSELFGIPLNVLSRAFGLPPGTDVANFQNKELETMYSDLAAAGTEIGNGSVKLFVAYYVGAPYTTDDEYLPSMATEILLEHADLTEEQISYLQTHTIAMDSPRSEAGAGQGDAPNVDEHDENEQMVRGKTTFADLLDWGLSEETIEEIVGGDMPNRLMLVRDYCVENGLEFATIKATLQEELDK